MKNPFSRFGRARDKPANAVSTAPSFLFGPSGAGKAVSVQSAIQVSAVYACVRVIAETIASLPLHVYKSTDEGSAKATEHVLYRILHNEPNREMTSFILRETMLTHLLLWGNSYSQIIRTGRNQIDSLYPLLPDHMEVDRDSKGKLTYTYTTSEGRTYQLAAEEVLHIPGLGFDGVVGYSPIALEKNAIGLGLAAEEYGSKFFSNGARPSGILTHPNTVKNPKVLRESWNSAYGGSSNSGRVAILEEGMKFETISMPNNEAQFLETRKFQVSEICRIFRVPPHLVGDLEHATFSNIEHQSISFAVHTIRPWLVRIEQAINRSLFSEKEKGRFYAQFNIDGLMRGAYKERMEGYAIARQNGWMSANDIRELENMNPLTDDQGGNTYLVNGNMIPINLAKRSYQRMANKFWNWVQNDSNGERTLFLEGVIAEESWFEDDVTPAAFKAELLSGSGPIMLHINSPGGDCIAASQIYTMLMDYPYDVKVQIDGIAASAASVIAMAGTKVSMSPTSLMMIHNPLTFALGDSEEMRKAIQLLEEVKESIINAYEIKTGLSRTTEPHDGRGTWMNANKAVELGFCDEVLFQPEKVDIVQNSFTFSRRAVNNFLLEKLKACSPKEPPQPLPEAKTILEIEPTPEPTNRVRRQTLRKGWRVFNMYEEETPMNQILDMREKRVNLWNAAKAFLDSRRAEDGTLSLEDSATYEKMEADVIRMGKEIERLERQEVLDLEFDRPTTRPLTSAPGTLKDKTKLGRASDEYKQAFWRAMRDKSVSFEVLNALQVGADSEGGHLVPDEYERTLVEALQEENIFRNFAHLIQTSSGDRKIPVVTSKGTASWIEEEAPYQESDDAFGAVSIGAFKLATMIKVSDELLNDSVFDIAGYIAKEFARRIGAAEEEAFIAGNGTGKPTGLLHATLGAQLGVTTAAATAITFDEVMDLFYSLRSPYRRQALFLMNDSTVKVLRKLKNGAGDYIWQPSITAGTPDKILNCPVYTSSFVPAIASTAKTILFGDMDYYWIADREGRKFKRLNELYAPTGQVGFLASQRVDGKLILPEAVKVLQQKA